MLSIAEYDQLIREAREIISRAETLLAIQFQDIYKKIFSGINVDSKGHAICKAKVVNSHIITKDLKAIFKKIAHKTHPDKGGDVNLFLEAKRALHNKDHIKLNAILHQVSCSKEELLILKKIEYENIIVSIQYCVAIDYLSGNSERIAKAVAYYTINLNSLLRSRS